MVDWFINLNYPVQAFIATLFTWGITALGAAVVFMFKNVNKNIMDGMLGLAAGVMIAATFWSLLSPAIEMAEELNLISWLVVAIGISAGGLLLFLGDKVFDYINKKRNKNEIENTRFKRCLMLITSITLHNIPEGIALNVV